MAEEQQDDTVPQLVEQPPQPPQESLSDEADIQSKRVTLADLSAKGSALYASKKYEDASEIFSEASNLQAEINGETSPENAEILFHYGRCLFKVGQSKSNVLGGAAPAQQSKPAPATKSNGQPSSSSAGGSKQQQQQNQKSAGADDEVKLDDAKKPLFQFTGDENFEDSGDEDDGGREDDGEGNEDEEPEEDEDDLSIAFEILDLARVCYLKQLDAIQTQDTTGEEKGKGSSGGDELKLRHIKERLADTHDCLAEISLENEKYPNAIEDGRTSLNYKLELYPPESEIIAEAHYKLSLALEFASVTTAAPDGQQHQQEGQQDAPPAGAQREDMDQGLRDEAVKEMEKAIASFRLKLQGKEVDLATMASPEDNDLARRAIAEMKEVITDMDQRLVDLKAGPLDTKGLLGGDANPLGGILGAAMGESASETKARVEEAKKTATDLSGLVRKKKPKEEAPAEVADASQHKRKASATGQPGSPKKAKVDEE